nr:aldo/keto reductase [Actinospica durhamensis]
MAASGIAREDLFVTTKLWNTDQGYDAALRAFDSSAAKLGLDIVDLYLIHWPTPARDLYLETWRAFEKLLADGRVRAIGVSNFQPEHLQRLLGESGIVPAVNQVELHPALVQQRVRDFDAAHGIATEAWSPLAKGSVLHEQALTEIAARHGKTPAQIVLRWHIQLGNTVIPKSVTPERIRQNIDVFDFELTGAEVEAITSLDRGLRTGPDPDTLN